MLARPGRPWGMLKTKKPQKMLAVLIAVLVPFSAFAASSAQAAGEKVSAQTRVTPNGGKFFKKKKVPSRLAVNAVVTPGGPVVNPTKRINLVFPAGMTFRPNRNVCPDKKLSPSSSLGSPSAILAACKRAVVGTGTAKIYLAKNQASPLDDPILIAFNAGKTRKGQPKVKIYGYSKDTGVGVLMQATLKGRSLNIAIPVLSFDSAVGEFRLQIPGPVLNRPELGIKTKGKNKRYVMASCPRSPLVTSSTFFLGQRNPSTGAPTSGTTKVRSKKFKQKCVGRRG